MGKKKEWTPAQSVEELGWRNLRDGIVGFLSAHGHKAYDEALTRKIGNFILTLTSNEPEIPLKGKKMRDLSAKQRALFQADEYEGSPAREFLGNWLDAPRVYFAFSTRTVSIAKPKMVPPSPYHKTVARLCHERPDPVVSYEKIAAAVPRFLRDMQGSMKYMSVDENLTFENADEPRRDGRVWFETAPVNLLLSILDHQDMHVHVGNGFVVIYNRWFGAYFEGE